MPLIARHYATGNWVEVRVRGDAIHQVYDAPGSGDARPGDEWIGPALWDIQTNGRWGLSFSDPALTVDQAASIIRAQAALGTARLCPTLISASPEATAHGVRTIAAACESDPRIAAMVLGLHLEGPYISPLDGFRGAHPIEAVRDPDWDEFRRWQDAAGGRIALMTLAPERPGAIAFIEEAVASGIVIALGHTAADGDAIRAAVDAGATLSTHLGNGIAATLPRHPNPIWHQAADDRLSASFIADGHHLDADTLKVLARAKGPGRVVLVSDASPLAGLPPGRYGDWAVDPGGKIVVAGTPYLAGSNRDLSDGIAFLQEVRKLDLADAYIAATKNPARLLDRPEPLLLPGQPANLLHFRRGANGSLIRLAACVDGEWHDATPGADERYNPLL